MIILTNRLQGATVITHNKRFSASDIFSAIIFELAFGNIFIYRIDESDMYKMPVLSNSTIFYNMNNLRFVPDENYFKSTSYTWRVFCSNICRSFDFPRLVESIVERDLTSIVDNMALGQKIKYDNNSQVLTKIIADELETINADDYNDNDEQNKNFVRATYFAREYFIMELQNADKESHIKNKK